MSELAKVLLDNVGAVIAITVVVALSIIAIFKINIQFDLNDFLKTRKARHTKKAQHYCAHMEFQPHQDGMACISWFESPPGTSKWICKTCKSTINHLDQERQEKNCDYWLKNPKKYKRNVRRYNYHARKSI